MGYAFNTSKFGRVIYSRDTSEYTVYSNIPNKVWGEIIL
jgi:hypothetical protein